MTLKEELTKRANEAYANLDISRYVEEIKNKLTDCYLSREFIIDLIKPKTTMAVGSNCTHRVAFFIPKDIDPTWYQQAFIIELKKLGFTDNDINTVYSNSDISIDYEIKLTW